MPDPSPPPSQPLRVITWNVNSIRTRLERVLGLLERHRPDLLCLQETKVTDEEFPLEVFRERGWEVALHGQKTYNGVALISRRPVEGVRRGFPGNPLPEQARVISGELGGVRVVNLYVVNGEAVGSEKYPAKLAWLDRLADWLETEHDPGSPLLLVGDFNIAPDDRDVHDPALWRGKVLVSDPERERLGRILGWGTRDLLRLKTEEGGIYSWWDYRMGAFARGWGLRIDLALGTAPVAERVAAVTIDREERKPTMAEGKPSDHAPVVVDLA
ncbi:MAG TPA: exodeoxyribonuclease III [Thermoanaerobaculia bacterium]|nr:exodeoxyribonuclease III [Thermoanaerobaculia bacterium]